jgi:PAS domain S-box-containing protein
VAETTHPAEGRETAREAGTGATGEAADALRRSEERFRALADAIPQIVCSIGLDGIPDYVNARWTEVSGLSADETARAGMAGVFHPDDVGAAIAALRRARATGTTQEVELRYRTRDGGYRWYLSRLAPVLDAEGRVVRLVGAGVDVDDRRRAADAREEAFAAVQEGDRRKSEFLAVLSHELRNPLAPIQNAVHLLERAGGDAEQSRRAREVILRQTRHLARLVDDLLDVTRITRGKVTLRRERLDLRELVRRTCGDHADTCLVGEVDLRYAVPAVPLWVDADPTRLAQVLGNVLQNALKFTPAGGSITVSAEAAGARAILRVRDTGAGIEPAHLERMFEPFVQADRTLARTQGGLGLGLALVKGLVEQHGGTVEAASDGAGRGTEVRVTLPLSAPPADPRTPAPRPAGARARSIVVVEDNPDAGQTLADLLASEGHTVHLARDAASGIALAREIRPDLVLCDIGLPDLDGYEVARRLRAEPALAGTRIVALSGYALPEDQERAREAGFDGHCAKPCPLERIAELIP